MAGVRSQPRAEPRFSSSLVDWLLDSDPAIRWQVRRDLLGDPPGAVETERGRVAHEGWGAELLSRQGSDGRWSDGLYTPKWTSTTYTMLLLHWLGLPAGHPQALFACEALWDGAAYDGGGLTLARSIRSPEVCITSMLVLLASVFGFDDSRVGDAVSWLLTHQLDDGGWNCRTVRFGDRHGSFHSSIFTLEALLEYERHFGPIPVGAAMARGREFFLDHHLYRSHRTGAEVTPAFRRFPFPPQWHFDVLRGLEHFRAADAPADHRLADAVAVVRHAQRPDGTWPRYAGYPGRTWLTMEPAGPSRWATLRATRVLEWWEAHDATNADPE